MASGSCVFVDVGWDVGGVVGWQWVYALLYEMSFAMIVLVVVMMHGRNGKCWPLFILIGFVCVRWWNILMTFSQISDYHLPRKNELNKHLNRLTQTNIFWSSSHLSIILMEGFFCIHSKNSIFINSIFIFVLHYIFRNIYLQFYILIYESRFLMLWRTHKNESCSKHLWMISISWGLGVWINPLGWPFLCL